MTTAWASRSPGSVVGCTPTTSRCSSCWGSALPTGCGRPAPPRRSPMLPTRRTWCRAGAAPGRNLPDRYRPGNPGHRSLRPNWGHPNLRVIDGSLHVTNGGGESGTDDLRQRVPESCIPGWGRVATTFSSHPTIRGGSPCERRTRLPTLGSSHDQGLLLLASPAGQLRRSWLRSTRRMTSA